MQRDNRKSRTKAVPNRRNLTDRFVKTVKPQEKRVLYWDETQKGFVLAVQPSGHKSYKLIYTFGRRPRWFHIADARSIGLKEARKVARTKMAEVVQGTDVQAARASDQKAGTFKELAKIYINERAKKKNRSWQQADYLINKHLLPRWANLHARSITQGDVLAVFNHLTDSGSLVLANRVLSTASAVFSWGVKQKMLTGFANPCHDIDRNVTFARERVLSETELGVFWAAFGELDLVRGRALRMLLLTGQRPGEITHMRHEHIDVGEHTFTDANGPSFKAYGGWWSLPGQPDDSWPGTKNGKSHSVWLTEQAVKILEKLDDNSKGYVFRGRRGGTIGRLDDAMRTICNTLGIVKPDKVTPHDLRRTHGTMVTGLRFSIDHMNRIQNHVEGGIGDVYDRHSYRTEFREIQEAVTQRIMALVAV